MDNSGENSGAVSGDVAPRARVSQAELIASLAQGPIVIYGAGNTGQDVYRVLAARGLRVECFLDQKAEPGEKLFGAPVLRPFSGRPDPGLIRGATCILAIFNSSTDTKPILAKLQAERYRSVLSFQTVHSLFATELGDRYWLCSRLPDQAARHQIEQARSLWRDDQSRSVYDALVSNQLSPGATDLLHPDLEGQYCPADLPRWTNPMRLVDAGAFDGDTIRQFLGAGYDLQAVAAFEPDLANYERLAGCLGDLVHGGKVGQAICFPCAVHSSATTLSFQSGGETSSRFRNSAASSGISRFASSARAACPECERKL